MLSNVLSAVSVGMRSNLQKEIIEDLNSKFQLIVIIARVKKLIYTLLLEMPTKLTRDLYLL